MAYSDPIHATAFSYHGTGCMLLGESGSGKSRLLAEAVLNGALLIADDQLRLCVMNNHLVASPVPSLSGVMELRGMGIIRRDYAAQSHPIHLVIELTESAASIRLPEPKTRDFLGVVVPFLQLPPPPTLSIAALLLYLDAMQEGRILPTDWRPATP